MCGEYVLACTIQWIELRAITSPTSGWSAQNMPYWGREPKQRCFEQDTLSLLMALVTLEAGEDARLHAFKRVVMCGQRQTNSVASDFCFHSH